MKKYILISLLIFLSLLNSTRTQQSESFTLTVIYPKHTDKLSFIGKPFFLLGNVLPADSRLKVNGKYAEVDQDGAFIVYTDIGLINEADSVFGKFIFEISNPAGKQIIEKTYQVDMPPKTSSLEKLEIDEAWGNKPAADISLQKGELVQLELKASPGSEVYCTIEGVKENFRLIETEVINNYYWGDAVFGDGFEGIKDTVKGVYKSTIRIEESLKNSKVTFFIHKPGLGQKNFTAGGRLTTLDSRRPAVVQTKYDPNLITGRFEPYGGYKLFLPEGIKLEVIGKSGGWLKTRLAGDESLFIPQSSTEQLPAGTPISPASIYVIRTQNLDNKVSVNFGFSERVPYKVTQHNNPSSIEITFYNVVSNIDWIYYDKSREFIKEIKWMQNKDGVLSVLIFLNQKTHWGYSPAYDGSTFKLLINKPPKRNSTFLFIGNQLKNRRIVIDSGHWPDSGAVGPRGTPEKDVNLAITAKLTDLLTDAGAKVFLTHAGGNGIGLRERKAKVNSFDPEISISIHNNAVPQSVDPIKHNGSSVYYYFPQALPLAERIHKNFLRELKLKDFGLYWDNLYMCRIPESISLLVEPAFMILPAQEKMLLSNDFQEKIAKSIFDAIESFYEDYSE